MTSPYDVIGSRIRSGSRTMSEGAAAGRTSPKPLTRVYDCDSRRHARAVVDGVLELQERTHHCMRVTCEGARVVVEVWTQGGMRTELDEEYVTEADVIFEDARSWA